MDRLDLLEGHLEHIGQLLTTAPQAPPQQPQSQQPSPGQGGNLGFGRPVSRGVRRRFGGSVYGGGGGGGGGGVCGYHGSPRRTMPVHAGWLPPLPPGASVAGAASLAGAVGAMASGAVAPPPNAAAVAAATEAATEAAAAVDMAAAAAAAADMRTPPHSTANVEALGRARSRTKAGRRQVDFLQVEQQPQQQQRQGLAAATPMAARAAPLLPAASPGLGFGYLPSCLPSGGGGGGGLARPLEPTTTTALPPVQCGGGGDGAPRVSPGLGATVHPQQPLVAMMRPLGGGGTSGEGAPPQQQAPQQPVPTRRDFCGDGATYSA